MAHKELGDVAALCDPDVIRGADLPAFWGDTLGRLLAGYACLHAKSVLALGRDGHSQCVREQDLASAKADMALLVDGFYKQAYEERRLKDLQDRAQKLTVRPTRVPTFACERVFACAGKRA